MAEIETAHRTAVSALSVCVCVYVREREGEYVNNTTCFLLVAHLI